MSHTNIESDRGPQTKYSTEISIELVEQLARVVAAEVGQQCLRQILEGIEDRYPAFTVVCSCGEEACFRYQRKGTLLTHFGRIRY